MTVASSVPSGKGKVLHPARFGARLLEAIAGMLAPYGSLDILDPFAGTGRVHELRARGTGRQASRSRPSTPNCTQGRYAATIRCKGGHNDRSQDW